eukprot:6190789-Pleurochrysis_carterae.AAC.1
MLHVLFKGKRKPKRVNDALIGTGPIVNRVKLVKSDCGTRPSSHVLTARDIARTWLGTELTELATFKS